MTRAQVAEGDSATHNQTPGRPLLRWHGGKWLLAPWIIGHFPSHNVYVEPYGGAASVLLRKPRAYAEIYNDLDDDVVGLFEVLRSPRGGELVHSIVHTPFARTEFKRAYEEANDPVERARRLIIRSFMGFGSDGHNGARPTGFRSTSNRSGTTPAHDWVNYPDHLEVIIRRLEGVVIENRSAIEAMRGHDSEETLHYVDPPYVHSTRSTAKNSTRKNYRHEMTDADHARLLDALGDLKGMVVLSGYAHPLYEEQLKDWVRVEKTALADSARPRVEVLWLNRTCSAALAIEKRQHSFFPEIAA
jgi:DNA adenine methylase